MFKNRTKQIALSGLALTLTVGMTPKAHAWADLGHEIVGAVAEQNIKPSTKDFVRGLMGIEPLEVSAVFPDHVRDDQRFGHSDPDYSKRPADDNDFSEYHFCEIPVGDTYATAPKVAKDCYGVITGAIALLKDSSGHVNREEKQIALRYLVHVMGDITQPLHVGNGFDIGANVCQIKYQWKEDSKPNFSNLHAFWDDTMVSALGDTYADPANKIKPAKYLSDYMAGMNRKRPEMFGAAAKAQYSQGNLASWLEESATIRESGVYPDDPTAMANVVKGQEYKARPYCLWFQNQDLNIVAPGSKIQDNLIPTVGPAYFAKFTPVVENQLLKGGLRLAATLDSIADYVAASRHPARLLNDAQQAEILKSLQDHFRHK